MTQNNTATKISYSNIRLAIDAELIIWRENQKDSISGFDFAKEIPLFNSLPNIFKAAAWFGLGMNAAEKLTPFTAVATMASRTAGPLAVLSIATEYFAKEYTLQLKSNLLKLENNGQNYKYKLRDTIDQASRDFYNPNAYGDKLIKKFMAISANDTFKDDYQISRLLTRVMQESGVMLNTNAAIGNQTKTSMGKIAKVIEAIYKSSNKYTSDTGTHMLKKASKPGPYSASDFKHSQCRASKHILINAKKGQQIGFLLADSITRSNTIVHPAGDKFDYIESDKELNEVLLNAWRYEAKHEEGGFFSGYYQCKTTWIWPAVDVSESLDLDKTYAGSFRDVEATYKKFRKNYVIS